MTSTKVYKQLISCEHNSSSFEPDLLKLCRCFIKVSRCAYLLDAILRLFLSLFCIVELSSFPDILFYPVHPSVSLSMGHKIVSVLELDQSIYKSCASFMPEQMLTFVAPPAIQGDTMAGEFLEFKQLENVSVETLILSV